MADKVPTERSCPFDPPPAMRNRPPVSRLRFGDGALGWVVTTHSEARKVLSDDRFSARGGLVRSPVREEMTPYSPGALPFMDPPEHTRYRRPLAREFTVRRMRALEPRIAEITRELLDAMEKRQSPVDFVDAFAQPLPSRMICELLGVPYDDHEFFESSSRDMVDSHATLDQRRAAAGALLAYLHQMVARRRGAPKDDVVSGLITTTDLTDSELAAMSMSLLFAGLETTANMLGLGTFLLLLNPGHVALLREDPGAAVEELLRFLSIVQFEVNRTALADVELGGELIRAGETVLVSLPMANRDPKQFAFPDRLDFGQPTTGHLAFGFGVHQCLGQQLARNEMRIGFAELFSRFPALELAVAQEEIQLNTHHGIYGVASLPVSWS